MSTSVVREAVSGDIPEIVRMGLEFIDSTQYREYISGDPESISKLVQNLVDLPEGCGLVQEKDGKLVGMIGVLLFAHPLSGQWIAGEVAWWVSPEVRGAGVKLLRKAEQWAREVGAERMQMIAPNERVGRFYKRLGYSHIEDNYQMDLV